VAPFLENTRVYSAQVRRGIYTVILTASSSNTRVLTCGGLWKPRVNPLLPTVYYLTGNRQEAHVMWLLPYVGSLNSWLIHPKPVHPTRTPTQTILQRQCNHLVHIVYNNSNWRVTIHKQLIITHQKDVTLESTIFREILNWNGVLVRTPSHNLISYNLLLC
jgi:hypothetical protein